MVIEKRATTALTAAQISAYNPYTYFAGAAYCNPANTKAWNCGSKCNALSGFRPTASGGDGSSTQFWYVGYYPTLNSIIVGYQGTDTSEVVPVIVDADFFLDPLNGTHFPGAPSTLQVHGGFGDAFDKSANAVYSAVQTTIASYPSASITVVGHSLGGAIAQLSVVSLRLKLGSSKTFKYVGYGVPRVGNPAWASYTDSLIPDKTRINNQDDIVPIVPGRFLGFLNGQGEIHITDSNQWLKCPGQDSTDAGCTIDYVPNVFAGDVNDHSGPYNGINIGC